MATTDWLIGSYDNLELQTFSVTTSGPTTEDCAVAAGDYYLWDETASDFHLCEALADAIVSHSAIGDVAVYLLENRHVQIVSDVSFTLNWGSATILRDLLGFTGTLTPTALTHTAPNISPLLWSPGKTTTWEARVGTDGIPVSDTAVGQSGPGTVIATEFNEYRRNTLIYRYLLNSRVWTTAEDNGELIAWWRNVLRLRRRFKVWRGIAEDTAGTDTLEIDGLGSTDLRPSSGAYIYSGSNEMPWGREFGFHESAHPVSLSVVTCREFDA